MELNSGDILQVCAFLFTSINVRKDEVLFLKVTYIVELVAGNDRSELPNYGCFDCNVAGILSLGSQGQQLLHDPMITS